MTLILGPVLTHSTPNGNKRPLYRIGPLFQQNLTVHDKSINAGSRSTTLARLLAYFLSYSRAHNCTISEFITGRKDKGCQGGCHLIRGLLFCIMFKTCVCHFFPRAVMSAVLSTWPLLVLWRCSLPHICNTTALPEVRVCVLGRQG